MRLTDDGYSRTKIWRIGRKRLLKPRLMSDSLSNAEGVKLVPLRKVAEGLGYEVKWNQETYAADMKKGAGWTSVSVGKTAISMQKWLRLHRDCSSYI